MGRIRRGGYIFVCWIGDHLPRRVHIFENDRLIAKVELDETLKLMEGIINRRIRKIMLSLRNEGKLK